LPTSLASRHRCVRLRSMSASIWARSSSARAIRSANSTAVAVPSGTPRPAATSCWRNSRAVACCPTRDGTRVALAAESGADPRALRTARRTNCRAGWPTPRLAENSRTSSPPSSTSGGCFGGSGPSPSWAPCGWRSGS
jgi:hypothetical protein